jgi:tetratricopeptide (TPR) repeat protein
MLHSNWLRGLTGAIGGLLLAGCGSVRSSNQSASSAATVPSRAEAVSPEKLASAHAHFGSAFIHEMSDEPEAALQEYYQAVVEDPSDFGMDLDVARKFVQAKQPEKALDVLNRAVVPRDASGADFLRLGVLYSQLGKTDKAIAANKTAIKKEPESLAGYQNLFLNYIQSKQPREALKVLDEAARQGKVDAEFLLGLAELYLNYGSQAPAQKEAVRAKAVAALNRADKLNPSAPSLRVQMAEAFNAAGEHAKAAQLYLDLLKNLPDIPQLRQRVRARLTEIYLRDEDRKRATEQLEAIVRDDPTNPQASYWLGSMALDAKKPAEAADWFKKTIVLDPHFEQAYYDLALAQLNLNQPTNALETLEKARQNFPQGFVLEFFTGMAFSHAKDYTNAIKHYTAAEVIARATDPKRLTETFYFQLGAAYERNGDLAQAEKNFQKCLELSPDFAEALNYLGYMWTEHDQNLPKARELIEKAVKLEPKNAAFLDSMGWVLYKQNQPKEALDYILEAVKLSDEPDATVYDHLGDIYAALKQTDKAREAWEKSVSLESNEQVSKKLGAGKSSKKSE